MKKLNRFFSIVLTAAIAISLLVVASPVSAGNQVWSGVATPGKTGLVMKSTFTMTGPMAQAIDGTLYAYVQDSDPAYAAAADYERLAKSTDGGRTWTSVKAPGAISAIATSPSEANVLYIAVGITLYKSADSGATFTSRGTVGSAITAVAAALAGGSYKLYVGTFANGVYFQNEGDFIPSFSQPFNLHSGAIMALKTSPSFTTDQTIVAVANAGVQPFVTFSVGSGQFNATLQNVNIGDATTTMASIAMPSDFNGSTAPFLVVGINGTPAGVYRVLGSATALVPLALPNAVGLKVASLSMLGTFTGGTIMVGTTDLKVSTSTDGGVTFSGHKKLIGPATGTVMVALKSDFATSGVAYAMVARTAANDASGFNISVDKAAYFNQASLINDSFTHINSMAVSGTTTWIATERTVTGASGTPAGSFTVTAGTTGGTLVAADTVVITGAALGAVSIAVAVSAGSVSMALTANGSGTATIVGNTIVLGSNLDTATITATSNSTLFTLTGTGTGAGTYAVASGTDVDGDIAIVAPNPFTISLPDMATTTAIVYQTGTATITMTAGTVSISGATSVTGDGSVATPYVVTVDATNTTATITNSGAAGAPAADGSFVLAGAVAAPTASVASPFSLATITGAGGTVVYNSLWRQTGSNWERMRYSADTACVDIFGLSPNYATDQTLFFTWKGSNGKLWYSNDAGKSFAQQLTQPGTPAPIGVNALIVLDKLSVIVGGAGGVVSKSADNGFTWTTATVGSLGTVTSFDFASDGSAVMAGATGGIAISTDLGATWTRTAPPAGAWTNVNVRFQQGYATSKLVYFTGNAGGLWRYDFNATTPVWQAIDHVSPTGMYASDPGAEVVNGVGLVRGLGGPQGMMYVADADGTITRVKCRDARAEGDIFAELIDHSADFAAIDSMFIVPGAGANVIYVVSGAKIFAYTDTLAVFGTGAAVSGVTTTSATITWDAIPNATAYDVKVVTGTATPQNPYLATNAAGITVSVNSTTRTASVSGLTPNTTYSFTIWGVAPLTTFHTNGTRTFSTSPTTPGAPVNLAPAIGATGIAVTPGFGWGAVAGATSYELELSTSSTFATLVGSRATTTVTAYAWTTPALSNNATYYWRVRAVTATGTSDWVVGVFTTVAATPTIPPGGTTTITTTQTTFTLPTPATPGYIWIIIGIGALLVIVVIVLIVRTRARP